MDVVASLPAFLLAVLLISASPGPAMALIFRRAALQGFRAAVPTVLGLEFGLYLWALMAGAGLAAILAAFQVVLETGFYLTLALIVGRARNWFTRPAIRRRLNAISGSVLITLGLRVAATSR